MKNKKILEEIVRDIKNSKLCESLIVFGSSLYDNHPNDIDLLLYSEKEDTPIQHFKFIKFLKQMDKKYPRIGFAYSSGKPRKKTFDIEIGLVPYCNIAIKYEKEVANGIYETHKVIFGNDPFIKKPELNAKDYLNLTIEEINNKCNDNFFLLKYYIRNGLSYLNKSTKKNTLIENFEKYYQYEISQKVKNRFAGKTIKDNELTHDVQKIRDMIINRILKENPNIDTQTNYPEEFTMLLEISRQLRQYWQNNSSNKIIKNYLLEKEKIWRNIISK